MKRIFQKLPLFAFALLAGLTFGATGSQAVSIQITGGFISLEGLGTKFLNTFNTPDILNANCISATECLVSNFNLPNVTRGPFGLDAEIEFFTGTGPVPSGGQGSNWSDYASFSLFRDPGTGLVTQTSNIVTRLLRSLDYIPPGEVFDVVLATNDAGFTYDSPGGTVGCFDSEADDGSGFIASSSSPVGTAFSLTPGSTGTLVAIACYRGEDEYETAFAETPLVFSLNVAVLGTPEPTTALMMGTGLLGLAWQGRRRRA